MTCSRGDEEIACDESGSDGENLLAGNTDVFAHGSVRLPTDVAAECFRELRHRIRSPAEEYKANHLLREKHRAVLEWLLAPGGPVHGHAHVHLIDKAFFVVDRTVGLLLDGGDGHRALGAVTLYRAGPHAFGDEEWQDFLTAAHQLLRVRTDHGPSAPVDAFFRVVDGLRRAAGRTTVSAVLDRLAAARPAAEDYRARIAATGPPLVPLLDPLLPAVVATVRHWSAGGPGPVRLVHDRQNMLTPQRMAWVAKSVWPAGAGRVEWRLVEARLDVRVQSADILAGIARKVASDELNGCGDARLTALLRPYIDTESVWGDAPSWARMRGNAANTALRVAG
ncbi:hypothetical protein [Streptomyces doebereineriae]|uniref:Uncharacterized protein n=1 Tax=Streptomyces doebereineriae TaxID=3075528 RepID=A0ABU2UZT2_9ACTN|nr:hypothetical protein [Streptomyces sp. DSM 41640]MDT0478781.1 hypothetical protein [Streptomyces sp. DSM 41640]